MKPTVIALILALAYASLIFASSQHLLEGPYDYDEHGKPEPRFYTFDGKMYTSIDQLKSTIAHLPPGSKVHWQGGCQPYSAVELGPRPYMSLSAFRQFCSGHLVEFDWYFGR